ncbi:MAG: hypothetical protein DRR19_30215 [Candidatus Parabeggiatoa sp. nov. 1]|nr:MAG: hypothetical protein DRR19_30215 [Gammaproteobacteria bacterium]
MKTRFLNISQYLSSRRNRNRNDKSLDSGQSGKRWTPAKLKFGVLYQTKVWTPVKLKFGLLPN